jgi:hypothetical protein
MEVDQPVVQDSRKQATSCCFHSVTPDKCGVLKKIKQTGTGNVQHRIRAA